MSNIRETIPLEKVVSHQSQTDMRNGSIAPTISNSITPFARIESQSEKKSIAQRMGGRRRKAGPSSAAKKVAEDGNLQTMGKIYDKIRSSSVLVRYFFYVLPLGVCIAIPIAVGATSARNAQIGEVRMLWLFTWIEIVWIGLWVSKTVAHFLPYLFQFLVGVVSPGIRKYKLVIKALEIPLSLVFTAVVALATFTPLMLQNPDTQAKAATDSRFASILPWQNVLRQILGACLAATLIFLVERLLIQLLSINYHRKQFSDRIQENKHKVKLLSLLYDASRALFPAYCEEFIEEDHLINDALNIASLVNTKRNSGSATPMRLLGEVGRNVGRVGDKVTSLFGNFAQEVTGQEVFNPNSAHAIVIEALERKRACEALARRVWLSLVIEGRDNLYEDDIIEVLGSDRHEEAIEAFTVFDRDGNGDVSLEEAILTVMEIGRERKSVASSMHDVDQAINVLDGLLSTVVFIVVVFIFVAFLNASLTTTLATAGTALLSLSFVFATTCQEVLGSCIFLFVKHPYDIGDRVDLNTGTDQMVVEHISLLFTVFKRVATGKTVQIPNIVLNTLWIENITRSKAMREQVSIFCAFDTTFDDIQTLREEMTTFVQAKENARDYMPDVDIDVIGIAEMNKMELRIEIRHKSNWANETVRAARRSKFMCALVLAMRRVPLCPPGGGGPALGDPNNPSFSVTISNEQAQHNKDTAATAKEAKRLVPTKTDSATTSGSKYNSATDAETNAVHRINSRSAARDIRDEAWSDRDSDSTVLASVTESRQSMDRGTERQSFDEASGMLRRQSTKGRRHPSAPSSHAQQGPALTPPAEETTSMLGGLYLPPPNSRSNYAPPPPPSSSSPFYAASTSDGGAYGQQPSELPAERLTSRIQTVSSANSNRGPPTYVASNAFSPVSAGSPTDSRVAGSLVRDTTLPPPPPAGPLPLLPPPRKDWVSDNGHGRR